MPLYTAGYLEDLNPWFEKDPEFSDSLAREVYDMQSPGGETTGVCMYLISYGLMYNVKMFEELGLEPPTSWDEFVEVSKKSGKLIPAFIRCQGWAGNAAISTRTIHQLAVQYGAKVVNPDGTAGFEHPGWKRALELWKEYYDLGVAVPNALGLDTMIPREMYANEQVAMLWEGPFAAGAPAWPTLRWNLLIRFHSRPSLELAATSGLAAAYRSVNFLSIKKKLICSSSILCRMRLLTACWNITNSPGLQIMPLLNWQQAMTRY